MGAANVLRSAGVGLGLATLLLDAAKGTVAALLAGAALGAPWGDAAVLAALLGHVYPPWLRFRGGKGVATAAGGFGVLHPVPILGALAVFALVLALSRRVSAASLLASAAFPAFELARGVAWDRARLALAAWLLILWAHRQNLARLLRGEEPRIGIAAVEEGE